MSRFVGDRRPRVDHGAVINNWRWRRRLEAPQEREVVPQSFCGGRQDVMI